MPFSLAHPALVLTEIIFDNSWVCKHACKLSFRWL